MMVKKNTIVTGCQQYLTELTTAASPYSPVTLPNGTSSSLHLEECTSATKQFLILSGVIILVGNFVQVIMQMRRTRKKKKYIYIFLIIRL